MPTLPPPPVAPPKNERERRKREQAMYFMEELLHLFYAYSYNTRSHMPHGEDWADSTRAWGNLTRFARYRPDWTAEIVEKALRARKNPPDWVKDMYNKSEERIDFGVVEERG